MHLVSYLGYLLGIYGNDCNYIIISKDKDYDNIVKFWKDEGYPNLSRREKLSENAPVQKNTTITTQLQGITQAVNSKISAGMADTFDGEDRSALNVFMQHELLARGYDGNMANGICKCVIAHCNDERMLSGIHNDLKNDFSDYRAIYEAVKSILEKYVQEKSKGAKRESQVRSFFGQHFKKKIYVDCKEEIIQVILNAKTKLQVNNDLSRLYSDGKVVSAIYKRIQPLICDLPGK